VPDQVIYREEVVALLFDVSDTVKSLRKLELLPGGEDDGEEGEADEG